jgi:ACS family hexuronate transporter-like MFS transporter
MSDNTDQRNRLAWLIVFLLFVGSALNYVDRSVLGVIMPQMRRDPLLTNAHYGLGVNAFLLMYAAFYVLGGRIADCLGYRRSVTVTLLFWSLANMAHSAVQGLRSLVLYRALLGIGEGGFYPAAMRGVTEWFPPESRAKAVGFLLSAISVGTLLTPPLVAWITLQYGWRASFLATGALGLFLLPPWLLVHRRIRQTCGMPHPGPAEKPELTASAPVDDDLTVRDVLRTQKYWCVLMARACGDSAWYFCLFWIPGYFQEVRGLDLASVGRFLWIPYFSSGVGALAGAWASSGLIRRGTGFGSQPQDDPPCFRRALRAWRLSLLRPGSARCDCTCEFGTFRTSVLVLQYSDCSYRDYPAEARCCPVWDYGGRRDTSGWRGRSS